MPNTVLTGYPHRMGGHCGSGALRDLMQWHGLGWDGPPSEGLVFTLGGALDFSYVRSDHLTPPIYLVGRGSDLELEFIRRIGGQGALQATDDPQLGWQRVRQQIDNGQPVLAWADIAELPYLRVRLRMSRHDIVIIGYDDDQQLVHVVDNDRADTQLVPYDALARARSSTSFPEPTRHTIYDIAWPTGLPDLGAATATAFGRSADAMATTSRPAIGTSHAAVGATGLTAVADFVEDFEGWVHVFDEPTLDVALRSVAAFVEKAGTGGGLFRRLLAEGCHDVAQHLRHPAVSRVADAAADAAAAWTSVAAAATAATDLKQRHKAAVGQAQRLADVEAVLCDRLAHAAAELTSRTPADETGRDTTAAL